MEQTLSYVHPNPGWLEVEPMDGSKLISNNDSAHIVGKHCIMDLYECDPAKLNDEAFVRTTLTTAAKLAGATLLNLITNKFEPQGVTGLALLAESHISIHTWPENGYAAADVFTCGDNAMPDKACSIIAREMLSQNYSLKSFSREVPSAVKKLTVNPLEG